MFGPDLVVQVQVKGWDVNRSKTNLGIERGVAGMESTCREAVEGLPYV
jgi:hypothetical protein